MAKTTVHVRKTRTKRSAEQPVSRGIRRTAERAGIEPSGELTALRKLATRALRIFEAEGLMGELTSAEILGEALRCAKDELSLFGDSIFGSGSGIDTMHLQRARDRIELALALAEYREDFGPIKSPWGGERACFSLYITSSDLLDVRAALAGNFWIDESSPGLRTEDAIMHIAAAQLKAVAIAMAVASDEVPDGDVVSGWCMNEPFTKANAIAAINGVASTLANAGRLLAETNADMMPSSTESEAANG
jgi:hypothetical protein